MNRDEFIESLDKDKKDVFIKYWYLFDDINYVESTEESTCDFCERIQNSERILRWRIEKLWNILNDVEYAAYNKYKQ